VQPECLIPFIYPSTFGGVTGIFESNPPFPVYTNRQCHQTIVQGTMVTMVVSHRVVARAVRVIITIMVGYPSSTPSLHKPQNLAFLRG